MVKYMGTGVQFKSETRPGVDKVKPKGWFKYSLLIDRLRISVGLFHHVLVYMGDLQLVHTALNFDNGAISKVDN